MSPLASTGTIPTVERFITGSEERAMYDNVRFASIRDTTADDKLGAANHGALVKISGFRVHRHHDD